MTFFRNLFAAAASLNVFATIRTQRLQIAAVQFDNANLRDANNFLRAQRNAVEASLTATVNELANAESAISFFIGYVDTLEHGNEIFLEERESFKERLALASAIIDVIDADKDTADAANVGLIGLVDVAESQANLQAAEILEVVTYVKSVEAKLAAAGIEIVDGESGPLVVVDEAAFVLSVATSLNLSNGQRVLQAA